VRPFFFIDSSVRVYAPLMPELREIVKFARPGQIPGLIAFSTSFVKFRCFPEPLLQLTIVAKDDQLYLFALYQIEQLPTAGEQLLFVVIFWPGLRSMVKRRCIMTASMARSTGPVCGRRTSTD
jgi:hypothetical protein